jgi:hypothetical protein
VIRWPTPGSGRLLWTVSAAGVVLANAAVLVGPLSPMRAAIALPVAVLVPGALALRALGMARSGWEWVLYAVAMSLAGLMAVGVVLSVLPGRALTTLGCLLGLDGLIVLLGAVAYRRSRRAEAAPTGPALPDDPDRPGAQPAGPPVGRDTLVAAAAVATSGAAVAATVAGAVALNAGRGPIWTLVGLGGAAAALVLAALAAGGRHRTAAASALFLLSAAILLATSLRGAGVTGHDIKIEYRVLSDTLERGSWRPGGMFAGYNSCLSITVLPAFLTRLLGVAALDTFRIGVQVLFAVVPVGVFLIGRRLVPPGLAMLGAGLFVAFPTFVNDMPMLNRQEIALIFFTVIVLVLLDRRDGRRPPMALFTIAAAGLVVAHYTTTYVTVALFGLAWPVWQVRAGRRSGADRVDAAVACGAPAVVLLVFAVVWAGATGSAGALGGTLYRAAAAVIAHDIVSSDSTRYTSLQMPPGLSDRERLAHYIAHLRQTDQGIGSPPPARGCEVQLLPEDELTRTTAGAAVAGLGVDPAALNTWMRGGAVLLYELGAVAGLVLLWLRTRRSARWGDRRDAILLTMLTAGGLALLAATVVAPQLADGYGLLRLYQQVLVVSGPVIVLVVWSTARWSASWLARRTRRGPLSEPSTTRGRRAADVATGALVVGCLLSTSGLMPQLTGGYPPQLNLNNAGPTYRAYYGTGDDVSLSDVVRRSLPPDSYIIADTRDTANLLSLTHVYPQEGLAPGAIPPGALLLVNTTDGQSVVAVAVLGERVVRYTFPLRCAVKGRTLLHAAGPHRVYGPVAAR